MQTATNIDSQVEQLMNRVLKRYSVFNHRLIRERVACYDDERAKRFFLEELAKIEAKDCPAHAPKHFDDLRVYYDPHDLVYCIRQTQ